MATVPQRVDSATPEWILGLIGDSRARTSTIQRVARAGATGPQVLSPETHHQLARLAARVTLDLAILERCMVVLRAAA